jgi:hypothetical protein
MEIVAAHVGLLDNKVYVGLKTKLIIMTDQMNMSLVSADLVAC